MTRPLPHTMTEDQWVAYRKANDLNPNWPESSDPNWLAGWIGNVRIEHRRAMRKIAREAGI